MREVNKKVMNIGIAITTRNRPEVLEVALKHFVHFWPKNYKVKMWVVDDFSDNEHFDKLWDLACEYPQVAFLFSGKRLGIAKAKNECLELTKDCDYVFLFDDDCFPQMEEWADLYINQAKYLNIHHMMHLEQRGILKKVGYKHSIDSYNNCAGCMLFFTRHALNVLGGFNKGFDIYGYEHAEITLRAHRAGLTNGYGKYVSPYFSCDFIYSADLKFAKHTGLGSEPLGIQPPLCNLPEGFKSSMNEEEKSIAVHFNARFFRDDTPIYQEL